MKPLAVLMAYVVACAAVALVWAVAVILFSARPLPASRLLVNTGGIFLLVSWFAALPSAVLFWLAHRFGYDSYAGAAAGGILAGAGLFVFMFYGRATGTSLDELATLVCYGGGLGLFGGLVFMASKTWFLRGAEAQ